jgi:hypothetical protein
MDKKPDKKANKQRLSILRSLFSKPERDREYMSDLNAQWDQMDRQGRVKFVIGGVVGAIVFFAALGLVLWVIGRIMG